MGKIQWPSDLATRLDLRTLPRIVLGQARVDVSDTQAQEIPRRRACVYLSGVASAVPDLALDFTLDNDPVTVYAAMDLLLRGIAAWQQAGDSVASLNPPGNTEISAIEEAVPHVQYEYCLPAGRPVATAQGYVPIALINAVGTTAFQLVTGQDPACILGYNPDNLYTREGKALD
ncbi:MAG: hypothetical protein M3Z04_22195 [Chloroflexota bacterium]|nr:hypothetical protein [Chloroflexota bacterium]